MPSQTAAPISRSSPLPEPSPDGGGGGAGAAHSGGAAEISAATGRRRGIALRSLLGDTLAIALVLAATNYFLSPGDPCWLSSNPTPLLLLPLLIGCRYGSAAGLFSGLLTTGAVLGVMHLLGQAPSQIFATSALALTAFPVTGLLCGEVHAIFKAKITALAERCAHLEESHGQASANLELFADSNLALQKRLAVHGVRLTSLDTELRHLLGPATTDLFAGSLALLNRVTEISEAAIYSVRGIELERRALLGNGDELPGQLRADTVEIIDQAIVERKMVTCRELWGDTPQLFSRHLAAIPWVAPGGDVIAILVVRRLPFHRATWQHFAEIETICTWIAQFAHLKTDAEMPSGAGAYGELVALCIDTHRRHALPSAAAYFFAAGDGAITQKQLTDAVAPHLRNTDLTTRLDADGHPNLAVILPMEGLRGAEQLVAQVTASLPEAVGSHLAQTEDLDSAERFLSRLTGGI